MRDPVQARSFQITAPEKKRKKPAAPQVVVHLPPQGGADEEDAIAFFVSPEDPLAEPEEVLVVQPAMPLSTPGTGGFSLNMILTSLAFIGSGIIIRKQLIK
jgi:hypothetical protein